MLWSWIEGDLVEAGVDDVQASHALEVSIGGPQFSHAAGAADGVNAGVMNFRTGEFPGEESCTQFVPVTARFREYSEGR